MQAPSFWKTDLEYIEKTYLSATKCTEKRVLCQSAGNRPVYMLAYGEKRGLAAQIIHPRSAAETAVATVPRGRSPALSSSEQYTLRRPRVLRR